MVFIYVEHMHGSQQKTAVILAFPRPFLLYGASLCARLGYAVGR